MGKEAEETALQWHPAFFAGIQIEFSEEKEKLTFENEHQLTNRLHCMIFAYLSKTPCLAFDNKSKKVSGVYEWIKDCEFIQLYDRNKNISKQLMELTGENVKTKNLEEHLNVYFDKVFCAISKN